VVGFNSSKIFCLHYVAMQTIDVPQSASLYRCGGLQGLHSMSMRHEA
jgi:hypothetical protein